MKTIILILALFSSAAYAGLNAAEKDSLRDAYVIRPILKRMLADIDSELAYATKAQVNKPFYFRTLKYLKGDARDAQMNAKEYASRLFDIRNRYALEEGRNDKVIWRLTAKEKE